ncbi:protein-export membrane protein SecD [Candidatus Roizmanbacteria bacterium RIFCSPHIGHO2_02_FULL_39_9]|uniref:Protein translocase subunit SecD n=1 Tax=Candidatus Roizmanbacteria bacterium RIFCSPHIGHO2_02_FULL_39_9 TaxID=1802040 RepID=A0A1F7HBY8_9BACT|nr:MAG: protein-export membrane protein SecD [Candidatus Roizmanbacteria bacterium RIFCSPHIGHO2_02_FULL_39_9]
MKFIKLIFIILIAGLILWIDLPENQSFPIPLGKEKYTLTLNPPKLDVNIGSTRIIKDFTTRYGLDLRGGSHLVFEVDTRKVKSEDLQDALNSVRDIVERRVNLFGVSEPVIQTLQSGTVHRISVDLPGISDVSEAVKLIGQTAQLTFKEQASAEAKVATDTPYIMTLTKETGLTGKDVKKASVVFDQQTGQPQVSLTFSDQGSKLFGEITQRNVGKPLGIFIDNIPISAPTVQQAILEGNAVITGNFSIEEAKQLAIAINSGALPVPIKLIEERNIGPSLGEMEIKKSVVAGVVGLGMVLLFMILYYGRLGVIASMALVIYGLISFAIFRTIPVVLTLSGIAGFILSIGMAVDSNILIFERIKEELRKGNDLDIAIKLGFGRAIDAIKDANITTLLVAFILFNPLNWEFLPQFGLVRGFALTLAIGVATSLFTGIVITKRLIEIFYK